MPLTPARSRPVFLKLQQLQDGWSSTSRIPQRGVLHRFILCINGTHLPGPAVHLLVVNLILVICLDYCNILCMGLPLLAQNAMVQAVFGIPCNPAPQVVLASSRFFGCNSKCWSLSMTHRARLFVGYLSPIVSAHLTICSRECRFPVPSITLCIYEPWLHLPCGIAFSGDSDYFSFVSLLQGIEDLVVPPGI